MPPSYEQQSSHSNFEQGSFPSLIWRKDLILFTINSASTNQIKWHACPFRSPKNDPRQSRVENFLRRSTVTKSLEMEDYEVDEKKQAAADALFNYSLFAMTCIGEGVHPCQLRMHLMKEISGMPTSLKELHHQHSSTMGPKVDTVSTSKEFSFKEFQCLKASNSKIVACHFSSDGKLLATAGHDKKAVIWSMDTFKLKSTLEEHNFLVTDVRFSSNPTRLATSSFDKTVKVWDADNPSYSLRSFSGHRGSVMSLDFHPTNEDLLCSCDGENEIRYWSVNQGICTRTFQGGMSQVRFQPRLGRLLAAVAENVVSIFDVESETHVHTLQRHTKPVQSVCWDANGDYMASVSEDSVRVWALGPGAEGQCLHELSCNDNKFHSCVFHPMYPQILVIGCYQSLELWSIQENKSMTVPAHEGLIEALAQSPVAGMVASASHDKCVKLWK